METNTARLNALLTEGVLFTSSAKDKVRSAIYTFDEALIYVRLAEQIRNNPDAPLSDGDLALVMSLALDIAGLIGDENAKTIRGAMLPTEDQIRANVEQEVKPELARFFGKLKYFYHYEMRYHLFNRISFHVSRYWFEDLRYANAAYLHPKSPAKGNADAVYKDVLDSIAICEKVASLRGTADIDYLNDFDKDKWLNFRENIDNAKYALHYVLKYAPLFCDDLSWLPVFVFYHLFYDKVLADEKMNVDKHFFPKLNLTETEMRNLTKTYPHLNVADFEGRLFGYLLGGY